MVSNGRPAEQAYLDVPGWGTLRLNLVRELDVDGRRVFYAFGPPNMPTPPAGQVRVEHDQPYDRPEDAHIRVMVQLYHDRQFIQRFRPPAAP